MYRGSQNQKLGLQEQPGSVLESLLRTHRVQVSGGASVFRTDRRKVEVVNDS